MTHDQAIKEMNDTNQNTWVHGITSRVVRILPEAQDPIKPNDNGWDVENTVHDTIMT